MTMARLWPFFEFSAGSVYDFGEELYDPVWLRCCEAVRDAIRAIGLAGVESASVILLEQPLTNRYFGATGDGSAKNVATPLAYPGIIVWPFQQEVHNVSGATNARDEIVYPVAVSIVDKNAGKTGTEAMVGSRTAMRKHMLWRERISRRFRFADWSDDIPEVRESNVEPNLYAIPELYKSHDLYHGAIVIRFTAWESRNHG